MDACDVTVIIAGPLGPLVCRKASDVASTVGTAGGVVSDSADIGVTGVRSVTSTVRTGANFAADHGSLLLGGSLIFLAFIIVRGAGRATVRTGRKVAPTAGKVALAYTGAGSAAAAVASRLPDTKFKGSAQPKGPTVAAGAGVLIDNHSHADPWPAVIDKEIDTKGKLKSVTICASTVGEARQKVHGAVQGHQFHEPIVKKCVDGGARINYRFRVR